MDTDALKVRVGQAAAALVEDGMVLGLGTGSTAARFVEALATRIQAEGLDVRGVPTSAATAALAEKLGIPLTDLADHPDLDLAVDGADEVTPALQVTKGMGGALLREKIVEARCARFCVIVDATKWTDRLGTLSPIPTEVLPFAQGAVLRELADLAPQVRMAGGAPARSDNGNRLVDLHPGPLADPHALANRLSVVPGVLEHGLFLDMATEVLTAHPDGTIQRRTR